MADIDNLNFYPEWVAVPQRFKSKNLSSIWFYWIL